ncbi:MAG: cell division protein FtsQ [Burkholderiaceae bacterium]|nr:cell division protein FtsQ [Burkholderiaceae bacterium]MDP3423908.1 cell division protein FtsQ [Burkholderiaceae bacterium]MDZ4160990.1 cell division protein FtsQ [Burkholderiales bacterium]
MNSTLAQLHRFFVSGLLAAALPSAGLAAPQLYDTGPAEDASFVRFVAAVPGAVEVAVGRNARLPLDSQNVATTWQPVRAKVALKATLHYAGGKQDAEVTVQPSEFVTLAVVPDEKGGWHVGVGREKPQDFSSHRVSLGLLNMAKGCNDAALKLAGKDVVIVSKAQIGQVERRMINPVSLAVDLFCNGQKAQEAVDLGNLRAGSRWTLLVLPEGKGWRLMPVLDRMP